MEILTTDIKANQIILDLDPDSRRCKICGKSFKRKDLIPEYTQYHTDDKGNQILLYDADKFYCSECYRLYC